MLWPAFGAHGKDKLTIAQALAHQAGVPGFVEPIDPALWLDPPACARAIAALAPMWPPGSASGYHPLTWGYIVGEIVARAADRSLGTILRDDICAPNGIDFFIGTPDSEHHRCPEMKKPPRAAAFRRDHAAAQGRVLHALGCGQQAALRNGGAWKSPPPMATERRFAVAQLYGVYATGGEIGGARVLSPETYAQLIARRFLGEDLVLPFTIDWRSGVMGNLHRYYGPNPEAIGHSGSGGSCGFGDPAARAIGWLCDEQAIAAA